MAFEWDEQDYVLARKIVEDRRAVNEAKGRVWRRFEGRASDDSHLYGYLGEMAFAKALESLGLKPEQDFVVAPAVLPDARDAAEDVTISGRAVDVKTRIAKEGQLTNLIEFQREDGFRIESKTKQVRPLPYGYGLVVVEPATSTAAILGAIRAEPVHKLPTRRNEKLGLDNHHVSPNLWQPVKLFIDEILGTKA